jgi:hypothetical protein
VKASNFEQKEKEEASLNLEAVSKMQVKGMGYLFESILKVYLQHIVCTVILTLYSEQLIFNYPTSNAIGHSSNY